MLDYRKVSLFEIANSATCLSKSSFPCVPFLTDDCRQGILGVCGHFHRGFLLPTASVSVRVRGGPQAANLRGSLMDGLGIDVIDLGSPQGAPAHVETNSERNKILVETEEMVMPFPKLHVAFPNKIEVPMKYPYKVVYNASYKLVYNPINYRYIDH